MSRRYRDRDVLTNALERYKNHFKKRKVNHIDMYETPEFLHPSMDDIEGLEAIPHLWSHGDKYFKLAHYHYGNAEFWWVIAWFNQKPTDAHVEMGDIIYIPTPLDAIISQYGL